MRKILLLLTLLAAYSSYSQNVMSKKEFTQHLLKEVSNSHKKLKVVLFDDLVLGSKFNNASFLHSLKTDYPLYTSNPNSLPSVIKSVIKRFDSLYAPDPNYKIDTGKIVPVLKPKEFAQKVLTNDEGNILYDNFNKELIIVYVEDKEKGFEGFRFFSENEFNRLELSKDQLKSLALKNLKNMLSDLTPYILDKVNYRYYRSIGMDGGAKYLSSLLLFPDFLKKELERLNESVVIGIPKDNQLIITSKKNKTGIREIKRYARMNYFLKGDKLLTNKIYLWDGRQFKKF